MVLVRLGSSPRLPIAFRGRFTRLAINLDGLAETFERSRAATPIGPVVEAWGAEARSRDEAAGGALLRAGPEVELHQGIPFVKVTGGAFMMGSDTPDSGPDERPPHAVMVSDFWIAQTETTRRQYASAQGGQPTPEDADLPLNVSWSDAKAFCQRIGGRLPTEAEWEYAARAGSETRRHFGDEAANLEKFAWFGEFERPQAHPVSAKQPNPLGLYDMHGNVWEWVMDAFGEKAYETRATQLVVDPLVEGPASALRVLRGGSWVNEPWDLGSADRRRGNPGVRGDSIGFRCVRATGRQP